MSAATASINEILNSVEATDANRRRAHFYQLVCISITMPHLPEEQIATEVANGNQRFDEYFSTQDPLTFEDQCYLVLSLLAPSGMTPICLAWVIEMN